MRHLARAAFLLSGVAGLTFEIVWSRYLGLAMGASTAAIGTVTAAYMGGLAIGSWIGGRWADRLRRPLVAYGLVEIGIAAIGLLIPLIAEDLGQVDSALGLTSSGSRTAVRFLAAAAVLLIPTTAMGMTLPILARAVTEKVEHVGREVGLLYALNIAGAVLGAAASGFWWIPSMGHTLTNWVAVGIDLGLGSVAVVAGLLLAAVPVIAPKEGEAPARVLRPGSRELVGLLAITGATAMALQVLWTRAISIALGPSTYAFSAIVCAYLLGLAFGGAVASRWADTPGAPRIRLSISILFTGVMTFIGISWLDDLPLVLHPFTLDTNLTPAGMIRTQFFLAALSVFPATFGMGTIFPLTLGAVVGSREKLGAAVGQAYAVNTIGSIVGSFGGLFVLLPLLGVEWGMRIAALAYAGVGGWLAFREQLLSVMHTRRLLMGSAAALAAVMLLWPSWDVGRWTLGLFRLSMAREYFATGTPEPSNLIFHRDGLHSTVTVEEEAGVRWIKVDGKTDGSSEGDMPTQIMSGLLPGLLRPEQKDVVVIGCGSCVTAGSALLTNVRKVTLVELEPEVLNAARLFEEANHAPWEDPRLHIVEDDGRNFMRRGDRNPDDTFVERFDSIISEPSNPWMTGAASLFTREFFAAAKPRLKPGGLFLQWLQIYELAPERVYSVLRTFQEAFPHVLVFSAHRESNDLLMVGSEAPIHVDFARLEQSFRDLKDELERADLRSPEELLALLMFGDPEIRPLEAPFNTDDNAFVEFGAPMDLITYAESDPDVKVMKQLAGRRFQRVKQVLQLEGEHEPEVLVRLAEGYLRQGLLADVAGVTGYIADNFPQHPVAERSQEIAAISLRLDEVDREAVVDLSTAKQDADYAAVAALLYHGKEKEALEKMRATEGLAQRSATHELLYGYLLYANSEYGEARRAFQRAAEGEAELQAYAHAIPYYLAKEAFENGEYARAVAQMRRYHQLSKRLSGSGEQE